MHWLKNVAAHLLVPLDRLVPIGLDTNSDLTVISHCKHTRRKLAIRSLFSKHHRQVLILVKESFRTAQEPLGERHIGFSFPALACGRVVLHRQEWVVRASHFGVFIAPADFVKGWAITQIGRALDPSARFRRAGVRVGLGRSWERLGEESGWKLDLGEFAQDEHSKDVRRLRDVYI